MTPSYSELLGFDVKYQLLCWRKCWFMYLLCKILSIKYHIIAIVISRNYLPLFIHFYTEELSPFVHPCSLLPICPYRKVMNEDVLHFWLCIMNSTVNIILEFIFVYITLNELESVNWISFCLLSNLHIRTSTGINLGAKWRFHFKQIRELCRWMQIELHNNSSVRRQLMEANSTLQYLVVYKTLKQNGLSFLVVQTFCMFMYSIANY